MSTTVLIIVLLAWVGIGIVTGLVEARHGHWAKTWILGAILGPIAVPLALEARRREASVSPRVLSRGDEHPGELHVLVGVDGSNASLGAAKTATALFGPRIGRMTLATVLDFDTAAPHEDSLLYPEPWEEERAAQATLGSAAERLSEQIGWLPASVLLAGRPADALASYAAQHGCDVLVTGCRGRGFSKSVLGSCASRLAGHTQVPVLLVPESTTPLTGAARGTRAAPPGCAERPR